MCSVPALETSEKKRVAVSGEEEMNEVPRPLPLTRTCAPATKFAPLTVSVNEIVPAIALDGLSDRMTGVVTANEFAATRRIANSSAERKVFTPHPQGISSHHSKACRLGEILRWIPLIRASRTFSPATRGRRASIEKSRERSPTSALRPRESGGEGAEG